jgi:hypothetical protein
MARNSFGLIFEQNKKLIKNADKIAWLQKHASPGLFYLLWVALSGKVEWTVPEGRPPFKPHVGRPGSAPSDLQRELRRLYIFLKDTGTELDAAAREPRQQLRREKLFQEILEGLEPNEIPLLIAIKDKSFDRTYRCSKKLVEKAFPGLFEAPFTTKFIR